MSFTFQILTRALPSISADYDDKTTHAPNRWIICEMYSTKGSTCMKIFAFHQTLMKLGEVVVHIAKFCKILMKNKKVFCM